ncbi:hypothetical protein PLESTF_000283300 [Pleodorina starrii]|nr:hypothetical protein PLESTM_001202700 [Pleodorina starrii]GLC65346.1 hypothetical protein PLESTF_000283300 [Pleodorina starrii]
MLMLSRHTAPVARRRPAAAYAAGATRTAAHVRTRTLPGSQVGRRTAPAPLFATKDPRDARESDYGSNEVPESWQDEWVSGNTHIDQEGRSAPSGGGESGSKGMAARRSSTAPTPRSSQPSRRNDEVPESWQDEWVSGNTHMEREDKSAASPGGGRTDSERMASRRQDGPPAIRAATPVCALRRNCAMYFFSTGQTLL